MAKKKSAAKKPAKAAPIPSIEFQDQVDLDQKRYSRYVCDSRAIPNEIDGMKPVQRRILWTMWNTVARNNFTKTVKVTGLVMGYHPHGDSAITYAISSMAQDFTFANNYPLVQGEGTFGDVLDPKAIASPRYTEVRLSEFAKDVGLFESIPDIDYMENYDETGKEPVFFVPKVPVVLLNCITGIATGFRCHIPAHMLTHVVDSMIFYLKKKKNKKIEPWYKGFSGASRYWKNDNGSQVFTTGFGFRKIDKVLYLTAAPQNWNREKVVDLLETMISKKDTPIRDYVDHSKETFQIEIISKKGSGLTVDKLMEFFSKVNNEIIVQNVITAQGKLENHSSNEIIRNFCDYRCKHLVKRFKRLAKIEDEKIARNTELIRFIKEGWNKKVTTLKNKTDFEKKLKAKKYVYYEWLSGIPVYRMTVEEVKKCREAITEAKKELKRYKALYTKKDKLVDFIVTEITELKKKWDK